MSTQKPTTGNESSLEHLQDSGIECYRKQDYEAALEHFTAALNYPKSHWVRGLPNPKRYELHNLRAAVYEKMEGKLEEAAKDAKQMIRLDDKEVTGYLRAGKIMGLLGKWEAALGIYQYGLERVPKKDKQRKQLEKMRKKVEEKVRIIDYDAKRADPLTTLPLELIDSILMFLDFRSIIRCQRVCRSWGNFLRKQYFRTYQKLNFSLAVSAPHINVYKRYIELSRQPGRAPIEEVTISSKTRGFHVDSVIENFTSNCPALHTLHIPSLLQWPLTNVGCLGTGLQTIILECELSMHAMVTILRNSKRIKKLECWKIIYPFVTTTELFRTECISLEILLFGSGKPLDDHIVAFSNLYAQEPAAREEWSKHMPNLRALTIHGWNGSNILPTWDLTCFKHLTQFSSSATIYPEFPRLPPTITHLRLCQVDKRPDLSTSLLDYIQANPLPNLHTLDLSRNLHVTNSVVSALLSNLPKPSPLRVLAIDRCPFIDVSELSWLLSTGHCDYLEKLDVQGLSSFGDAVTREMGTLGWLREIDMSSTMVTGAGLMNIVNGVGKKRAEMSGRQKGIESIRVIWCEGVGIDAIDLARKLGVKVSYIAEEQTLRGRKVRDAY